MTEVIVHHEKPMSILAIVAELREHGYVQRKDFDFAYYPSQENNGDLVPRHTVFSFYADELASWFALKYAL